MISNYLRAHWTHHKDLSTVVIKIHNYGADIDSSVNFFSLISIQRKKNAHTKSNSIDLDEFRHDRLAISNLTVSKIERDYAERELGSNSGSNGKFQLYRSIGSYELPRDEFSCIQLYLPRQLAISGIPKTRRSEQRFPKGNSVNRFDFDEDVF